MSALMKLPGAFKTGAESERGLLRWGIFTPVVVTIALILLAATQGPSVNAAQPVAPLEELSSTYADRGGGEVAGADSPDPVPIASGIPVAAGSNSEEWLGTEWTYPPDDECWLLVWSARMIVGVESESTTTYRGYIPDALPEAGDLAPATFDYRGEEYVVKALFQQDMTGGDPQLVLRTDRPLPNHLLLSVGNERVFVFTALVVTGQDENTYTWPLDNGLGWEEGDVIYATLAEAWYREPGPEETNPADG